MGRAADVLVVGGGPAGRALAGACARLGLRTGLVDRAPDRPWRSTFAAWADELPATVPASAIASRSRGRAIARTERPLGWEYTVLDVDGLRAHLDAGLAGVTLHRGRVLGTHRGPDGATTRLADGRTLEAAVVLEASGHRPRDRSAEQTAHGTVVDAHAAAPLVAPGEALFMDWRPHHGEDGWPTFLYAVPLGDGTVLLEETSLARRPGLPLPVLRRRLAARLDHHGIAVPADAREERVRFPVDGPRSATGFGAAAPLVHPATGFSVATALTLAPAVAAALARSLPGPPERARRAARDVVWSPSARAVHLLRRRGLEALLRMPPATVPAFFEVFLGLPPRHRWAYLTARDDLGAMLAAMSALFARSDWSQRARLVAPALLPRSGPPWSGTGGSAAGTRATTR
ncbi:MAG: lycopene cyclase family protein [Pseudonocardia sp.]|nr:lycopene cyclase family protein [Pseudonocardia sp.]